MASPRRARAELARKDGQERETKIGLWNSLPEIGFTGKE